VDRTEFLDTLKNSRAEAVQSLDDQDLHDPARFAGMPADWSPWRIIAGNSFEHYRAHASDLRQWLDKQSQA